MLSKLRNLLGLIILITPLAAQAQEADIFELVAPRAGDITSQKATIFWETNQPSTSVVNYRSSKNMGTYLVGSNDQTSHAVILSDLIPDQEYFYLVLSTDQNGTTIQSQQQNFKTLIIEDEQAPIASNINTQVTTRSAVISWSTDEASQGSVIFFQNNQTFTRQSEGAGGFQIDHKISIDGLEPNTQYNFRIDSVDVSNNQSLSPKYSFETAVLILPIVAVTDSAANQNIALEQSQLNPQVLAAEDVAPEETIQDAKVNNLKDQSRKWILFIGLGVIIVFGFVATYLVKKRIKYLKSTFQVPGQREIKYHIPEDETPNPDALSKTGHHQVRDD